MNIKEYLFNNEIISLDTVNSHKSVECITRYFASGAPTYVAIHKITNANQPEVYTKLHSHDTDEINIILSTEQQLKYECCIGDNNFVVQDDSTIFIPRDMLHSANVISGSGYYIAVRL